MRLKEEDFKPINDHSRGKFSSGTYGEFYCFLDDSIHQTVVGLRHRVQKFGYTLNSFYDEFYKSKNEGICKNDQKSTTTFEGIVKGYKKFCFKCENCRLQTKHKQSEIAKNPEVISAKIEGRKKTYSLLPENYQKDAAKRGAITREEKYGKGYHSRKAKIQWDKLSESERKEIGQKSLSTKIARGTNTGGEHCKETGKRIKFDDIEYFVQGYEDAVMKYLYNKNLKFVNGKNVPRIPVSYNKSGVARPDIFIPDLNLIIEVKSPYTWLVSHKYVLEVAKNAKLLNYEYVIIVLDGLTKDRQMKEQDQTLFEKFLNMPISSEAQVTENVQRLEGDSSYRPTVIGSGSARVPGYTFWNVI